jgi:hypothetical protein
LLAAKSTAAFHSGLVMGAGSGRIASEPVVRAGVTAVSLTQMWGHRLCEFVGTGCCLRLRRMRNVCEALEHARWTPWPQIDVQTWATSCASGALGWRMRSCERVLRVLVVYLCSRSDQVYDPALWKLPTG